MLRWTIRYRRRCATPSRAHRRFGRWAWLLVWLTGTALCCERPLRAPDHDETASPDFRFMVIVARTAGCTIERLPELTRHSRRLMLLEQGEVDVLSLASLRPKRVRYAHFSDPYRMERIGLFARADSTLASLTLFDLPNVDGDVLAPEGWFGDEWVKVSRTIKRKHRLTRYSDFQHGLQLLHATPPRGVVMMGDVDLILLASEQHRRPPPRLLGTPFKVEPVHFMFSRKSVAPETVARFNAALKAHPDFFKALSERRPAIN
nr:transporter substrate-binding domain-containing protein [Permianibacter aggregans]